MLPIFESLLPVFLLIAIGAFLKYVKLIQDDHWAGLERISYFLFFPALLVYTIYKTDFSTIEAGTALFAFFLGLAIILVLGFLLRVPMEAAFGLSSASYSSVFQGFTRWNGFVALAIAEKMGGPDAVVIVAMGIGAISIPISVVNLIALIRWGERSANIGNRFFLVIRNPLVIGTASGLVLNFTGFKLYLPFEDTLRLVSQISLPMGLLLVGAGLRFIMPRKTLMAVVAATGLKLLLVPAIYVSIAYFAGLRGSELVAIAIAGCVPSAMNGYLLAKDLGGDAPLYAAIVTMQIVVAFFSIPFVILLATYIATS